MAASSIELITGPLERRPNIWDQSHLDEIAKMAAACRATAVFVNLDKLSTKQRLVLKATIKKPIYDRLVDTRYISVIGPYNWKMSVLLVKLFL